MGNIDNEQHGELIRILDELVEVITARRKEEKEFLLVQHEREAKEWNAFLRGHTDKEELISLRDEIVDRFFYKYDVQIGDMEVDKRRLELMEEYLSKSYEFLK